MYLDGRLRQTKEQSVICLSPSPDTLFLMYDGGTHFWTVYKKHELAGGDAVDMAAMAPKHKLRMRQALLKTEKAGSGEK